MRSWLTGSLLVVAAACGGSNGAKGADAGADSPPGPADGSVGQDSPQSGDGPSSSDGPAGDGTSGAEAGGPTFGGCPLFPPDYPYNQDISQAALDPGSATYIANLSANAGAIVAEYPGGEFLNVVPSSQAAVAIQFDSGGGAWGFDTTDTFYSASTGSAPIPPNVVYENMTTPNADHHVMVIQQGTCRLFEMYSWDPSSSTSGWSALVTWNLTDDEQLPDGWGSTTAAGTPLVPGVSSVLSVSSARRNSGSGCVILRK